MASAEPLLADAEATVAAAQVVLVQNQLQLLQAQRMEVQAGSWLYEGTGDTPILGPFTFAQLEEWHNLNYLRGEQCLRHASDVDHWMPLMDLVRACPQNDTRAQSLQVEKAAFTAQAEALSALRDAALPSGWANELSQHMERVAAGMTREEWNYWGNQRTHTAHIMYGAGTGAGAAEKGFSLKTLFAWLEAHTLDAQTRVRRVGRTADTLIELVTALRSVLLAPCAGPVADQPEADAAAAAAAVAEAQTHTIAPTTPHAAAAVTPVQVVHQALYDSVMKSLKGFLLGNMVDDCLQKHLAHTTSPTAEQPRVTSSAAEQPAQPLTLMDAAVGGSSASAQPSALLPEAAQTEPASLQPEQAPVASLEAERPASPPPLASDARPLCRFGERCPILHSRAHCGLFQHPVGAGASSGTSSSKGNKSTAAANATDATDATDAAEPSVALDASHLTPVIDDDDDELASAVASAAFWNASPPRRAADAAESVASQLASQRGDGAGATAVWPMATISVGSSRHVAVPHLSPTVGVDVAMSTPTVEAVRMELPDDTGAAMELPITSKKQKYKTLTSLGQLESLDSSPSMSQPCSPDAVSALTTLVVAPHSMRFIRWIDA